MDGVLLLSVTGSGPDIPPDQLNDDVMLESIDYTLPGTHHFASLFSLLFPLFIFTSAASLSSPPTQVHHQKPDAATKTIKLPSRES